MAEAPSLRSPRAVVAALRSSTANDAASLVAQFDARTARLALVTLRTVVDEDFAHAADRRSPDDLVRLMLMIRCGLYDHAIRTERGPVFAVSQGDRPAVERVIAARLAAV